METQSAEQYDIYQPNETESDVHFAHEHERDFEREGSLDIHGLQPEVATPQEAVAHARGGEAVAWSQEYAGEGKYSYENGEIINKETGESLVTETERAYGSEEAAILTEGLQQWTEGGQSAIRTPDYVEESPDKTTVYVTQYLLEKDGNVRYEIWSYSVDKKSNEDIAFSSESLDTKPESAHVQFAELPDETDTMRAETEVAYAVEATADIETDVEAERIVEFSGENPEKNAEQFAETQDSAIQPGVEQTVHVSPEFREENWLQEFLEGEPLDLSEEILREEPTAHMGSGATIEAAEKESAESMPESRRDEFVATPAHIEKTAMAITDTLQSEAVDAVAAIGVHKEAFVVEDVLREAPEIAVRIEAVPKTTTNEPPAQRTLEIVEKTLPHTASDTAPERAQMQRDASAHAPETVTVTHERTQRAREAAPHVEHAREKAAEKTERPESFGKDFEIGRSRSLEISRIQNLERPFARNRVKGNSWTDTKGAESSRKSPPHSRNGITLRRAA